MTTDLLTFLIVMMGSATVLLSAFVAWRFWWHHRKLKEDSKKLTVALVGMLVGELCIGLITLIFALLAWSGRLPHLQIEVQSVLRMVAFGATSFTTLHLFLTVEKLYADR